MVTKTISPDNHDKTKGKEEQFKTYFMKKWRQ